MKMEKVNRILDALIAIAFIYLIYMLVWPQYTSIKEKNLEAKVKANLYEIRCAVEQYAAYNNGYFPKSVDDFIPYLHEGKFPVNPYTGSPLTKDDIKTHQYIAPTDPKDDSPNGVNGKFRGEPGKIVYAFFIPPGDTLPTAYGLVGFNKNGEPIFYIDPGKKKHIFVLHN
ncbi:hypothetical protein DRQ20_06815 [bacterium]|nr:MAG: hypothetical protein DRQ20_06815 [bacterium]